MHNREASDSRFVVQDSFVRRTNTDAVAVPPGACQSWRMRAPNFYAHPGFERAGLRRRESEWDSRPGFQLREPFRAGLALRRALSS